MSIGVYIKPARGWKKGGPWLRIEGFELLEQKFGILEWYWWEKNQSINVNQTDQYIFIMRKLVSKISPDQRVGISVIIQNDN